MPKLLLGEPVNIGPINTRCRIEQKVTGRDPTYGAPVEEWTLFATRWCGVQDVLPSRAEKMSNDLVISVNTSRLRMRYCTDIHSGMRIIINRPTPITYQIISGPAILGDKDGVEFMIQRLSSE